MCIRDRRKPAHEGIKERCPRKVVILPLLATLSWKQLQSYQHRWLWKTLNFQNKEVINFCDFRLQRTLQECTATKWLEIDWQFANRNCYMLSRVPWALSQISCNKRQGALITELNTSWRKLYKMHLLAYGVQKKVSLKIVVFSATAWNFNAKFYTLITSSHLHKK